MVCCGPSSSWITSISTRTQHHAVGSACIRIRASRPSRGSSRAAWATKTHQARPERFRKGVWSGCRREAARGTVAISATRRAFVGFSSGWRCLPRPSWGKQKAFISHLTSSSTMARPPVLLGHHGTASGTIETASPINYLSVKLKAGERWRYQPPKGQAVAWSAVSLGRLLAPDAIGSGELAVFEGVGRRHRFPCGD